MLTIQDLKRRHEQEIKEFEANCKHQYENGDSAISRYADDDDLDGWRKPTLEEWDECQICGTQWLLNK